MSLRPPKNFRNRLIKQTFLFFLAGCVIIALFIIVIIPIFVHILAGTNNQPLPTALPGAAPVAPSLQLPYDATNSASLSLKGEGMANATTILVQNGTEGPTIKSDADGTFTFTDLTLASGDNTFQAITVNDQGIRSTDSATIHILYSSTAPKLDITSPSDGTTYTQHKQQVVSITGATDVGGSVTLNGEVVFVSSDGTFTTTFALQNGDNTLHFIATNKAGNTTSKDITLHYLP